MNFDSAIERLKQRIENPGLVEGTDEDDQLLDLINGSIKIMPTGLILNPLMKRELNPKSIKTLDQIIIDFSKAQTIGRAALERGTTDEIVPSFGPVGHPVAIPAFKKAIYVKLKSYWWGFRLYLSHQCVNDLVTAGAGAIGILVACGVAAWIAAIVAAVVAAIKGFDKGNGVTLSITWIGVIIWIRSGKHL